MSHNLHVANSRESLNAYAITTPNKDFKILDVFSETALKVLFNSTDLNPVESVEDLVRAIIDLTKKQRSKEEIIEFIAKVGVLIPPRKVVNVLEVEENFFKVSFLASMAGAKDYTLFLMDQQLQVTYFNTNSDHSWIVGGDQVYRAKYGTLWQPDPEHAKPWM